LSSASNGKNYSTGDWPGQITASDRERWRQWRGSSSAGGGVKSMWRALSDSDWIQAARAGAFTEPKIADGLNGPIPI
jgi:hypothetical protein